MSKYSGQLSRSAEGALALFKAREITADPEQRDPRRWGPRHTYWMARNRNHKAEQRAKLDAAEREKDEKLNAQLNLRFYLSITLLSFIADYDAGPSTLDQPIAKANPQAARQSSGALPKPPTLLTARGMGNETSRLPHMDVNSPTNRGPMSIRSPSTTPPAKPQGFWPTGQHPPNPQTKPTVPKPATVRSEQAREKPQPSKLDRKLEFTVLRVVGKRKQEGDVEYSVQWKQSWVPFDSVLEGSEGKRCVAAQSRYWEITGQLEERTQDGIRQCKIQWDNTWEPVENLKNAEEEVAAFEAGRAKRRGFAEGRVPERRVLTIAESNFPPGRLLPQSEEDYAEAQRHVARYWPEIHPYRSLDLYPAIYCILVEMLGGTLDAIHGGKSIRSLLNCQQVRPLTWREEYVRSGRTYTCTRRRRSALILQVVGVESDHNCCERCSVGGDLVAFFVECVHLSPTEGVWFGGACTNCAIQDSIECAHHKRRRSKGPRSPQPNRRRHRSMSQEDGSSHEEGSEEDFQDPDSDYQESDGSDEQTDLEYSDHEEHRSNCESDNDHDHDYHVRNVFGISDGPEEEDFGDDEDIDAAITAMFGDSDPDSDHSNGLLPPASDNDGIVETIETSDDTSPGSIDHLDLPAPPPRSEGHELQRTKPGQLRRVTKAKPKSKSPVAGPSTFLPTPPVTDLSSKSPGGTMPTGLHVTPYNRGTSGEPQDNQSSPRLPDSDDVLNKLTVNDPMDVETDVDRIAPALDTPAAVPASDYITEGHASRTISADPNPANLTIRRSEDQQSHLKHADALTPLSEKAKGKKRAASDPPSPERPSTRPHVEATTVSTDSPALPTAVESRGSSTVSGIPPAIWSPSSTIIPQNGVHLHCTAGEPCRDPSVGNHIASDPEAIIYHNTLHKNHQTTIAQVEYILSRCNCHWASYFATMWHAWRRRVGEDQQTSLAEFLLPNGNDDELQYAAAVCCPRGKKVVVVLDD
ncbi:hypothetical protein Q7P37_002500 [Cladosporium fusiforme]